jgi:hypothetical protein
MADLFASVPRAALQPGSRENLIVGEKWQVAGLNLQSIGFGGSSGCLFYEEVRLGGPGIRQWYDELALPHVDEARAAPDYKF